MILYTFTSDCKRQTVRLDFARRCAWGEGTYQRPHTLSPVVLYISEFKYTYICIYFYLYKYLYIYIYIYIHLQLSEKQPYIHMHTYAYENIHKRTKNRAKSDSVC